MQILRIKYHIIIISGAKQPLHQYRPTSRLAQMNFTIVTFFYQ